MTKFYARQGDLVIEKLDQPIQGDLIKRVDVVFAGDSSGHRHRLLGEVFVQTTNTRVVRVRIAKATDLVHEKSDGHESVQMKPGDYEIRPLRERDDRAVED